ncbi:hypothetical protein L6164_028844 [Bauhinia variegata]|uniref:Uncharacterized protein n=1 Tax=Bauhinia variegata TaxID=167791 RepID=A0ACB9L709_BAUVA|nr:hypothetical protein L6164_028844 [Bauhinia variegata]
MAAASVSFNGIVSEVLTNDNYENWSALVKNYLIGQGFWDVVSSSSAKSGDEDWKMKNGKALHAIQLSCGSDALAWIRNCETAKEAWNQLSFSFSSDMGGDRDTELGIMDDIVLGHNNMKKLRRHVETGNWDAANYYIDKNKDDPDVVFSACSLGRTILHIAVIAGREEIVEKLIEAVKDKEKLLKSKDNRGYTALALAAKFTDKLRMAKFMVEKCKDLLTINSMDDEIPVLLASANGHKEMTRYLYSQTPWDEMSEGQVVHYGGLLLTRCISAQIFYVALTLLRRQNPSIPLTHESENLRPLYVLSQMPHVFPSGYHTKTVFERFLYEVLEVDSKSYSDSLSRNIINKTSHADQHKGREASEQLFPLTLIVWTPLQNVILENLSVLLGFKEIYEAKLTHYLVSEILKELERRIYKFHESELKSASAYNAMLLAAQGGIRELLNQCLPFFWITFPIQFCRSTKKYSSIRRLREWCIPNLIPREREEEEKSILESLLSNRESSGNIKVINIMGTPGAGKTGFADVIYFNHKVREYFEVRAWVNVPYRASVSSVAKKILEAMSQEFIPSNDFDLLRIRLQDFLAGKKFLIVLDDCRIEDDSLLENWNILINSLEAAARGSAIILTANPDEDPLLVPPADRDNKGWQKKNAKALHVIQLSCGPYAFHEVQRRGASIFHKSVILRRDANKLSQDPWDVVSSPADRDNTERQKKNAKALHVIQLSCGPYAFREVQMCESARVPWNQLSLLFSTYKKADQDIEQAKKSHGLWNVVLSLPDRGNEEWQKKNALALYAIQLSCGPYAFPEVQKCETAKIAWNQLSLLSSTYKKIVQDIEKGEQDVGVVEEDRKDSNVIVDELFKVNGKIEKLYEHLKEGKWEEAKSCIDEDRNIPLLQSPSGRTILHIAVMVETNSLREEIVEKLIDLVSEKEQLLEKTENYGYTALALAATYTDSKRIAECMVSNCGNLLTVRSTDGEIPILLACENGHKEMTRYLYKKTPRDEFTKDKYHYGILLLARCIRAGIFDVALALLRRYPELPLTHENKELRPLYVLAQKPAVFSSGCQLKNWWQKSFYKILYVKDDIRKIIDDLHDAGGCENTSRVVLGKPLLFVQRSLLLVRRPLLFVYLLVQNLICQIFSESGSFFSLESSSCAALQMRRELQLFKKVEKMADPTCKEAKNVYGKKPRDVFDETHEELVKAAPATVVRNDGPLLVENPPQRVIDGLASQAEVPLAQDVITPTRSEPPATLG